MIPSIAFPLIPRLLCVDCRASCLGASAQRCVCVRERERECVCVSGSSSSVQGAQVGKSHVRPSRQVSPFPLSASVCISRLVTRWPLAVSSSRERDDIIHTSLASTDRIFPPLLSSESCSTPLDFSLI